jgi:plasmid stabilization system protein ParE
MLVVKAAEYIAKDSLKEANILIDTFNEKAASICKMPEIGITCQNGMRKIKLGKFRYNLFYRVRKSEIFFLGIHHTSRGTEFEP